VCVCVWGGVGGGNPLELAKDIYKNIESGQV
jgi:hypothetical protein